MQVIVSRESQTARMRGNVDEMPEFSLYQPGGSIPGCSSTSIRSGNGWEDAEFHAREAMCLRDSAPDRTAAGHSASDASPLCGSGHSLAGRARLVLFPRCGPRFETVSGQPLRPLTANAGQGRKHMKLITVVITLGIFIAFAVSGNPLNFIRFRLR